MRQALHIIIWKWSAILLLTSSRLKLCQVGVGQIHIFRFLHKYLIGFKLRLWLGHSKTFRELCASGHCPVGRWAFCPVWGSECSGFSLRLSQYFGALRLSSTLTSPSVPAAEKQPHSTRLLPAHFTVGMYSAGDERTGILQTWCLELKFIRPENLRVFFSCFFVNSKCVFMCLNWREDWVWPHHHKALISVCLSFCKFLQSAHMIMSSNRVTIRVLHHPSNQSPSPSVAQFGQEASSRKNPGCFKLLPLRETQRLHASEQNFF